MTIITIHANSRELLDSAAQKIRSTTYEEYSSGNVELPEGVVAKAGTRQRELYDRFSWHELIEFDGNNNCRKIYTTDPKHPFVNKRAMGKDFIHNNVTDCDFVYGVDLHDDKVDSIDILDNMGQLRPCKEFIVFEKFDQDGVKVLLQTPGWWKIVPPIGEGELIYFTKDFYSWKAPCLVEVKNCWFMKDHYFDGYWQVEAFKIAKFGKMDFEIKLKAASWMFQRTPEISYEEGYCYKVEGWYGGMPGCPPLTLYNLPCFLKQEDAIAFLDAAPFAGCVTRHLTIRGLKTGLTDKTVHRKMTQEPNNEISRKRLAELIAQAKLDIDKLVFPMQSLSVCRGGGHQVFI